MFLKNYLCFPKRSMFCFWVDGLREIIGAYSLCTQLVRVNWSANYLREGEQATGTNRIELHPRGVRCTADHVFTEQGQIRIVSHSVLLFSFFRSPHCSASGLSRLPWQKTKKSMSPFNPNFNISLSLSQPPCSLFCNQLINYFNASQFYHHVA